MQDNPLYPLKWLDGFCEPFSKRLTAAECREFRLMMQKGKFKHKDEELKRRRAKCLNCPGLRML